MLPSAFTPPKWNADFIIFLLTLYFSFEVNVEISRRQRFFLSRFLPDLTLKPWVGVSSCRAISPLETGRDCVDPVDDLTSTPSKFVSLIQQCSTLNAMMFATFSPHQGAIYRMRPHRIDLGLRVCV